MANQNNAKPKTWQQETIRRVYEMDKAIEMPSNQANIKDPYALPYDQVWEYSPAQGLDERYPFPLQIAGSEFAIKMQLSLGKFLHDTLGRRLGYLVRFEDFWEQWCNKGFSWTINRTGTPTMVSNYPLQETTVGDRKIPGWRVERKTRPAYLEWTNPNKAANPYYRIIEYWRDRSNIEDSYVLVGSDSQIIQHIVAIEYQGGASVTAEDDFIGGGFPRRMGQPQVTLYFKEDRTDVEPGWNPVKGNIAFRLMDVTDNPDDSRPKISWTFIEDLAKKIYAEFQQPNNNQGFIWKKGKEYFNYNNWDEGYGFKILCRNSEHGEEIVRKLLNVRDHIYDAKNASKSEPIDSTAYPTIPEEKTVLGTKVRQKRRRPIADVRFIAARLTLARWPSPIVLINKGVIQNFSSKIEDVDLL